MVTHITKLTRLIACFAVLPPWISLSVFAQTWSGGATDANWSTSGNWSDGVPSQDGSSAIVFTSSGSSPSYVDASWKVANLSFQNTGAFTLTGMKLSLASLSSGYWISSATSAAKTIENDLSLLLPNQTNIFAGSITGGSGNLSILGNISIEKSGTSAPSSATLQLRGTGAANSIGGNIQFASDTAATRILAKTDSGTWTVGGSNNNFTQVNLAHGTLKFASSASMPTSANVVFKASANGFTPTLELNNQHLTINNLTVDTPNSTTPSQARISGNTANGSRLSVNGDIVVKNLNTGWFVVNTAIDSAQSMTIDAGGALAGIGGIALADGGTISVSGIITPGGISSNRSTAGTFSFGLSGTGKLEFLAGSSVQFDLGETASVSDRISFTSEGDWLSGSGNASLDLTEIGSGINYSATYTIFQNVTTTGFVFANITGYDAVNYVAHLNLVGTSYQLSFATVPESAQLAVLMAIIGLGICMIRRLR